MCINLIDYPQSIVKTYLQVLNLEQNLLLTGDSETGASLL